MCVCVCVCVGGGGIAVNRQRWCTQVIILVAFRAIKVKNSNKKEDGDLSVMLITREKHHTFIKAVTAKTGVNQNCARIITICKNIILNLPYISDFNE